MPRARGAGLPPPKRKRKRCRRYTLPPRVVDVRVRVCSFYFMQRERSSHVYTILGRPCNYDEGPVFRDARARALVCALVQNGTGKGVQCVRGMMEVRELDDAVKR